MKRRSLLAGAGALAAAPLIDVPAAHAVQTPSRRQAMVGAEVLAADDWKALAGQKVGVISNPTGILPDLSHIVDTMHASGKVNIVAVFGPEHGFRGTAQAGGSVYSRFGSARGDARNPGSQRLRHRRDAV